MSISSKKPDSLINRTGEGAPSGIQGMLLPRSAAAIPAVLGLIVLAGWAFEVPLLKSVLPGAVEMKANTAVGLVLSGCALFILGNRPSPALQRVAVALSLAVALLGFVTLGEYAFGWQAGIDELLFRDTAGAYNLLRGRMSPYSALVFACIGVGMAVFWRPHLRWLTCASAIVAMAIGGLSFVGYLWNATELVTDRLLPPVAIHTAVAFLLLGAGMMWRIRGFSQQEQTPFIFPTGIGGRILAGVIAAMLMLLFASALTYRGAVEFTKSAEMVSHTQEVRVGLRRLYAATSDAESAQRNYLITGKSAHIDDYARLNASIKENQNRIAILVADNQEQLTNLAQLANLIEYVQDLLKRGFALYQQQGFSAAQELVSSGQSIRGMKSILQLIDEMDAIEAKLLAQREAALVAAPKDVAERDPEDPPDFMNTTTRMRRMAPGVSQAEAEGTLVLLVDDHPTNRLLLTRQVKALGYAVESAENGVEAFEKWKSGRFGIIITDCNMPEMDGYELTRSIRSAESARGSKRIPIVACTANALDGEAEICFAAGMDDYLSKPIELKELLKKLDQWLPIPEQSARQIAKSPMPAAASSNCQDASKFCTGVTPAAGPVDRSVLAAISDGDAVTERAILKDFRRVNDEDTAMLKRAVDEIDLPKVAHASHRIKGASSMVGALGLASVCETIEKATRAGDLTTIQVSMNAFHTESECVIAYIDSFH